MSFTDALSRISTIQQQMTALDDGSLPSAVASASSASSAAAASTTASGSTAATFADTLSRATRSLSSASVSLPAGASTEMTSDQRQFASTLSAETGLSPGVVCAWMMSEENGGAAQSRQAQNNNDWLNIGYTDTATIGASDTIWSDPVSAATATAKWLKGTASIPGYGVASSGVQSILSSVGQTPQDQISALQNSGWASGGYPDLMSVYEQVMGG